MPYTYKFGDKTIKTRKKLYRSSNGTWCHRQGDYLVPVSPKLMLELAMVNLEELSNKKETK